MIVFEDWLQRFISESQQPILTRSKYYFETIINMYSKDYSEIFKIFYGVHVSQLSSIDTNEMISMNPEPFFILNLPIPNNNKSPSLIDCFNLYVEDEILDGDNSILNESTGKRIAAKKNIMFWNFPNILVIDIKRFNAKNTTNEN